MTPWEAFVRAVEHDPAAPRVTFYERTPGPTQGERIELSGKVLLNWASKAANLLLEEFDVEPGTTVSVALPASHWRSVYWLLGAWANGATVVWTDSDAPTADAGVDADAAREADVRIGTHGDVDVLVTLPALARGAVAEVPPGALDEARDLPTFADQFVPATPADAGCEAIPGTSFAALGETQPVARVHLAAPTAADVLAGVLGGGIVLVRGAATPDEIAPLLRQEGLTA